MKLKFSAQFLLALTIGASVLSGTASAAIVLATNTQPVTAADVAGSQVTFTATFTDSSSIAYQWKKNTGGGAVNIPGATNTTLTLSNLQLTDAATYSLQASNASGVMISAARTLTVNPVPAVVSNIITSFAAQTGLGTNGTNFVPTWTIVPGSLIAGQAPSSVSGTVASFGQFGAGVVAVLTDGSFGTFKYIPNVGGSSTEVTCGTSGGQSVTYSLTGSATGYDLTNIIVFGGWGDAGRDQQAYTISYSTVTNPSVFVRLTSVNYNPANAASVQSATRATLTPFTASPLAQHVAAVRFDFTTPAPENGYCGYSEIDLFGVPSSSLPVAALPTSAPGSPVYAGTIVTLNEASGGMPPLQFQWQSDNGTGGATFTDISGATGSNYVLNTAAVGVTNLNFRVRVTDTNGASTSPALLLVVTNSSLPEGTVGNLRCEHLQNPLGIDVIQPRLSWIYGSSQRGNRQSAYQVLVASSPGTLALDQGDVWDSGQVNSSQSVLVGYGGPALASGQACYWKVRIWDRNGNPSAWSQQAMWSMGLLSPGDWSATWIGMTTPTNISPAAPSPMLRKTFSVTKTVARATAYICGLGYYELQINGAKVGDHLLDPAWTRYDKHAEYVTYDVTTNLAAGANAVGVQLANGYYNQWTSDAWNTATAPWRALPQLRMQLDIQYTDNTHDLILSDGTWKASTGALVLDTTRLGEVYDARLEKPGWSTAGYDDSAWAPVKLREGVAGPLIAPDAEPIKVMQNINAVSITPVTGQPGVYMFDFGQNLVGWGQLNVTGPAGTAVTMVYGEKINSDNSVNQNNINVYVTLKQYFQTDTYTLKGGGPEVYEPRFAYHGFRYAQVSGLPSAPTTSTLVARVIHTAFDPAGSFLCSSDLLNRIETNTMWSYIGNFVGIPTDCPHREKNGWTGDTQLAAEVGLTHFHSEAAYTRWIKEFGVAQLANGKLAGVFPNAIWSYDQLDGPAWESAFLLAPWFVYQHCGDVAILTNNYAGMKAYVDYCTSVSQTNIVSYGLNDWEPANTSTPASVTDTGYYYENALIVAQTAAFMGKTAESQQYSNLAAQIKVSFNNSFYNPTNNLYSGGTQTAQSCALYQGMVGSTNIPAVAGALAAAVRQNGNNIDTGILGSKYLLRALCDNGHADTALALATQTTYPSWGNQVNLGATTLWETWSGAGGQDSLNHIMFGDISAWFMEYVAGIRPGDPGYKTVTIKPDVVNGLAWAEAVHDSPYGPISSAWHMGGQLVTLDIVIPPNATGTVYLPTFGTSVSNLAIQETGTTIWQNGSNATSVAGVAFDHAEGIFPQTYSVWKVDSGAYHFAWNVVPVPTGLAAAAANSTVNLSWNPVGGTTGYNVKRSPVSGGPYITLSASVAATNYIDTAVTNNVTYYYVVSAVSTNGESGNSAEATATPGPNVNFGFETPHIASYQYNPAGAIWTFGGALGNGSGITGNNTGFTSSNPNAPEGTQVAFVQSLGSISQALTGFIPGTNYTITFSAAQRAGANQHGGESWTMKIDTNVIASYSPAATATTYVDYTANFTATASTHTLSFVGTDVATGDNTVFIDNVRIVPPVPPVFPLLAMTSPVDGSSFTAPATVNFAATVTTNGDTINSVQFYNATNLIAQVVTPPYAYAWTSVGAGSYSLRARVVFNGGSVVDSTPAGITVSNPTPPSIQSITLGPGNTSLSLTGTGQIGQSYVLMTTTNLAIPVWSPVLTNQADSSGNFGFTNLPATNLQQYYRISTP